jgi:hypothetical protein
MPIAASAAGTDDQSRDYSVNTPGASPSTLAGGDDTGTANPNNQAAPGQSDEGLKQAVQRVRQIQVELMDLARQFPAAASSLRASTTGLRAALRQIIANPGSPEPPTPNVGG